MSLLDRKVMALLAGGFALVILLMLATGKRGLDALGELERGSADLLTEELTSGRALSLAQEIEIDLDEVFYSVPGAPPPLPADQLRARIDGLEQHVRSIARDGQAAAEADDTAAWLEFEAASLALLTAAREATERSSTSGGAVIAAAHARVRESVARLVRQENQRNEQLLPRERRVFGQQFGLSLRLLALTGGLAIVVAGSTLFLAYRLLNRLESQRAELERLSADVLNTQESTLRQVSHDLHDQFGQTLTAIEANLSALDRQSTDWAVKGRVEDCIGLVQDLMSEARTLSQLLRPSLLDDFGLVASLEWQAERFTERTGIEVAMRSGLTARLPSATETHLFRIAQEALTNVARHSGATSVEIGLDPEGAGVRLKVADNGRGLGKVTTRTPTGMGLRNMRARASQIGGAIDIGPRPGGGTTVSVLAPLEDPPHAKPDPIAAG